MFYALAKGLIPAQGLSFEHILQDIQTLNERATRGELDVSAISIHAYAYVSDKYALLPSGASMGDGYGPMLVAKNVMSSNEIAKATGDRLITANEIKHLSIPQGRLKNPLPLDQEQDTALGREIYLRRYAGQSRVTIFEGGHEGITAAALDWLKRFHRLEDGNIYDGSKQK